MPLTNCPDCGHSISTAAVACPQCGYPMQAANPVSGGPKCYSCGTVATTRCQACGVMSCVRHLQSIYVPHGKGGANELRCESCYSSAQTLKTFLLVFFIIAVIIVFVFMSSKGLGPFGE
jgi:hypothetical protein